MATQLPTTYLDPILDTSVNAKKLFKLTNQTTNEEMTVTIEDITTYLQIASTIGAGAFNTQNQVINSKLTADTLVGKLAEVLALTQPGSVADALVLKEMNANFQAGCSKIASAITANGVSTASNASPTTMATNIGNIRSGGTASADKILSGYTAYVGKNLLNGTNLGYTVGYNTGYNAGYNTVNLEALLVANSPNISYTTTRAYRFIIGILTGQHDYKTSGNAWISNGGGGATGYIKQNNLITVSGTSQRVTITVAWFSGVPQGGTVAMGSNFFGSDTQCFGAFIGI